MSSSLLESRLNHRDLMNILDKTERKIPYSKALSDKKDAQYTAIDGFLKSEGISGGLAYDLCCGKGIGSEVLLKYFEKVIGIDINHEFIKKNNVRGSGAEFFVVDLMGLDIISSCDMVFGLHCCGDLTDKAIFLASEYSKELILFPCCYSKISRQSPMSLTLSRREEVFSKLVKRVSSFEGKNSSFGRYKNTISRAYKRSLDIDRMLYLKERGFKGEFCRIIPDDFKSSKSGNMNVFIHAKKNS